MLLKLGQSEDAADDDDKVKSTEELGNAKGKPRHALTTSSPIVAMRSPIMSRGSFNGFVCSENGEESKDIKARQRTRPVQSGGQFGQGRCKTHENSDGIVPAIQEQRPPRRGLPLLCLDGHLIAVNAGHNR